MLLLSHHTCWSVGQFIVSKSQKRFGAKKLEEDSEFRYTVRYRKDVQEGSRPDLRLTQPGESTPSTKASCWSPPWECNPSLLVVLLTQERVGILLFSQQWFSEEGRNDLGNKRVQSPEKRRDPKDGR